MTHALEALPGAGVTVARLLGIHVAVALARDAALPGGGGVPVVTVRTPAESGDERRRGNMVSVGTMPTTDTQ